MKHFLFLALWLLVLTASAQKTELSGYSRLPLVDGKVAYTAVVPVEGATKDQLFTRATEWSARNFKDSKTAERMNDREAGTLIAQAMVGPRLDCNNFTISIYVKDNRYKYLIDQITWTYGTSAGQYSVGPYTYPVEKWGTMKQGKGMDKTILEFDGRIQAVIKSLDQAMQGKASAASSSDW